jgi:hypothetical protein
LGPCPQPKHLAGIIIGLAFEIGLEDGMRLKPFSKQP